MVVLVATCLAGRVAGQDTVHFETSDGPKTASGTITDFTGKGGVLLESGGRERRIPAATVTRIETLRTPSHVEGDARLEANDYAAALTLFREARREDQRVWVRRLLTARIVRCLRAMGEPAAACDEFILLLRSDPETPYLDCIPLAWSTSQPPSPLESKAEEWIAWTDWPAARLLAASHLLTTPSRARAIQTLKTLARSSDAAVARLAATQLWRTTLITAAEADAKVWEAAIRRIPSDLRAGPYFLLGQLHSRLGDAEHAVLAWMRVPIDHPSHHRLAAECLMKSADALAELGRTDEAIGLCREVVNHYNGTPSRRAATVLLERL